MNIKQKIRELRYRPFSWLPYKRLTPSTEPIDVVIPIISKDLKILPLCLEGVRNCVNHPIKDIYIVAPQAADIIAFCKEHGLTYIDEKSVLGFGPRDITNTDGSPWERSGWLFQQLLKLSGRIGTCRHYLCIDADHILIKPHTFLTDDGKTVFYMSYEYNESYYYTIHRLLPSMTLADYSYVDHKMLFDKEQLEALHTALSQRSGKSWTDTIIDDYDRRNPVGFSEFELYGNFVKEKVLRPWLQKRLPYRRIADYKTLVRRWARWNRWTLTFPDYMN